MNGVDLIKATIARRTFDGLGLRAHGAEGYTVEQPFTCFAKDAAQRDGWKAAMERKGFTVEVISA